MLEFFKKAFSDASSGELLTFLGSIIGAILGVFVAWFITSSKERREKKIYQKKLVNSLLYEVWANGMKLWVISKNIIEEGLGEDNIKGFEYEAWLTYRDDFMIKHSKDIRVVQGAKSFYSYYQLIKDNSKFKDYDKETLKHFLSFQINVMKIIKRIWIYENTNKIKYFFFKAIVKCHRNDRAKYEEKVLGLQFKFEEYERVLIALEEIKENLGGGC